MEERKRQRERKSAAYWLSKCSVLYPIGVLYVMYVKQVEVYITELSVHVSAGTMLFAYALCLILWLASPIRTIVQMELEMRFCSMRFCRIY